MFTQLKFISAINVLSSFDTAWVVFLESFVPFRVYRFREFEVFWSGTVPFTAHEQYVCCKAAFIS